MTDHKRTWLVGVTNRCAWIQSPFLWYMTWLTTCTWVRSSQFLFLSFLYVHVLVNQSLFPTILSPLSVSLASSRVRFPLLLSIHLELIHVQTTSKLNGAHVTHEPLTSRLWVKFSDFLPSLPVSAETNSGFCYSSSGFLNDRIPNNWSI